MRGIFSEDLKRRVRDACDLAELIRYYGVELKRAGRSWKACCPFHNEKTPSFNVNAEGQYFKCFGCGKSGDVFTFVMEQERVEFPEAFRMLAERAGITIESNPIAAAVHKKESDFKGYLYKLNAAAAAFYKELLLSGAGHGAREYLHKRGLTEASWERFGLGFAPPEGSPLMHRLMAQKAPLKALERAGLVKLREDGSAFDFFRGRVMFPITDAQGRTIGFGGRVLDDSEPKYLNTSETPLFSKGRTIYGLFQARQAIVESRRAVLVEGYTDVIMCHQYGLQGVVACLGTAVTVEHVRALRRLADELHLLTDSDAAGARASERGLEVLFQEDMPARVVRLPGADKDPCDFLLSAGRAPFEEALAQGVSLFEYKVQRVARSHDLASVDGQARAARELMALISLSGDPAKRAAHRRDVAALLNLPERALEFEAERRAEPSATLGKSPVAEAPAVPEHALAEAEREILRWIFHRPAWLEAAVGAVDLMTLSGKPERVIGRAVLAALDAGRLPPDATALAGDASTPAGAVAREVLAGLGSACGTEGGDEEELERAFNAAQKVCIALAEDAPEHTRLNPDEAFELRVKVWREARARHELAAAKRAEAAARTAGDAQALAAALGRVKEWQGAVNGYKRVAANPKASRVEVI